MSVQRLNYKNFPDLFLQAFSFYRTNLLGKSIKCPALSGNVINFTWQGWYHLFKHEERSLGEIANRLIWLPWIEDILSTVTQSGQPRVKHGCIFYGISKRCKDRNTKIRVIIEESMSTGERCFCSIFESS